MIARKLICAYLLSFGLVFYLSIMVSGGITEDPNGALHLASAASAVSLYVLPFLFVYGVGISLLIDWLLIKLRLQAPLRPIVAGLLYLMMGYLPGVVLQIPFLGFYGMLSAGLYYLIDRVLARIDMNGRRSRMAVIAVLLAPIALFSAFLVVLYWTAPQPEPFTREDAVAFAASGNGTVTDLFPDREGTIELTVDGYRVERETRAAALSVALGKERYTVAFIERWSKDGKSGENRMSYTITRGTADYSGSEGEELPYRR